MLVCWFWNRVSLCSQTTYMWSSCLSLLNFEITGVHHHSYISYIFYINQLSQLLGKKERIAGEIAFSLFQEEPPSHLVANFLTIAPLSLLSVNYYNRLQCSHLSMVHEFPILLFHIISCWWSSQDVTVLSLDYWQREASTLSTLQCDSAF